MSHFGLGFIAALAEYNIENATLFDGSTGYLSRTPATDSGRQKYIIAIPYLRSKLSTAQYLYTAGSDQAVFQTSDALRVQIRNTGVASYYVQTSKLHRDTSGWGCLIVSFDSTNGTAVDRLKVWDWDTEYTSFSTDQRASIPLNMLSEMGDNANLHVLGASAAPGNYFNGYMGGGALLLTDVSIQGGDFAISDFVERDVDTNNPVLKNPASLSFGTNDNDTLLDFSNVADLGEDQSGNGNDWTENGTITQVTSTPTDVFATWNPLFPSTMVYTGGNLNAQGASAYALALATLAIPDGVKIAWQHTLTTVDTNCVFGVADGNAAVTSILGQTAVNQLGWDAAAGVVDDDTVRTITGLTTAVATDVIEIEIDDAGDMFGRINGTYVNGGVKLGTLNTGIRYFPAQTQNAAKNTPVDFGQNGYAPTDSSYLALSTDNLPAMVATDKNVNNHFKTVLYTGDGVAIGSGGNAVTGVGFQPDFVWPKIRDGARSHNIYDAVRGATKYLLPNTTDSEQTVAESLASFDADGFTLGSSVGVNESGKTFVAWCASLPNTKTSGWAGSPSMSPDKEIYNSDLKISVVDITTVAVAANGTFPHSLDTVPGMIIGKRTDSTSDWIVWHSAIHATSGNGNRLVLNTTAADAASTFSFAGCDTQLVTLGSSASWTGDWVFYIFAESDFIKIGSFEGNANADGAFANMGISPSFFMQKAADIAAGWSIFDTERSPYNTGSLDELAPNDSGAEPVYGAEDTVDINSNGVKQRSNRGTFNPASTVVYLAIGQPTGASNAAESTGR